MKIKSTNVHPMAHRVSIHERNHAYKHHSGILWMTGLSASGKSTLALELEKNLFAKGYKTFVLDGDNVRSGLNADLGFDEKDRNENIRRVGEVAALFAEAGLIVIAAFISPYNADRDRIRQAHPNMFHEIYINASLEDCEGRDPKGLYKRARNGEIPLFTGVSEPYEPPLSPELTVDTVNLSVAESVQLLEDYVEKNFRQL
jgi:bifunctional enzyme CysN/CysC